MSDEAAGGSGQPEYPRQELLPQQVKTRRSRLPLLAGAVAVVLLVVGGLVAWRLLAAGPDAQYCTALRKLTHNGDLTGAFSGPGRSVRAQLQHVVHVAPSAVAPSWHTLQQLASHPGRGKLDPGKALQALGAVKTIANDARSNCGLNLQLPGGL